MTGLSTAILIGLVLLVLVAPRRWALLGMMAGILYLTQGNYVHVLGLTIYPTRFLALAAFVRVLYRRELRYIRLGRLDAMFIVLYAFVLVVYALRTDTMEGYYIGLAIDAVLSYFAFRGLVHGFDEYGWFLRMTALLLVPYAILVCIETYTAANPFVAVGGVENQHCWRQVVPGRSVASDRQLRPSKPPGYMRRHLRCTLHWSDFDR